MSPLNAAAKTKRIRKRLGSQRDEVMRALSGMSPEEIHRLQWLVPHFKPADFAGRDLRMLVDLTRAIEHHTPVSRKDTEVLVKVLAQPETSVPEIVKEELGHETVKSALGIIRLAKRITRITANELIELKAKQDFKNRKVGIRCPHCHEFVPLQDLQPYEGHC